MTADLVPAVAGFLAHKRALGRKYRAEEATLRLFSAFALDRRATALHQLTPALIEAFVVSRPRPRPRSFNQLIGILGSFFKWTVAQQLLASSPLQTTRRRETTRLLPFIFDTVQAGRLLAAAAGLPDNSRALGRATTYHTLFALCYGLGLRAGEACGLQLSDVDVDRRLLVVRGGKFGKSRLVPHGPRIAELVARQVDRRGGSTDGPLFSFDGHRSIHPCTASQVFHRLAVSLELAVPDGVSSPTLHSLRHSFAVGCLLRWYRDGEDPSARLFQLSTFMGHVDPTSTAVYLSVTPGLLAEANRRFEAFASPVWSEVTS
jgi:integrase